MASVQCSPLILYNERHKILFIKINRPESLNSVNMEMLETLHYLLKKAKDENLSIVFSGKGRALSAGADIVAMAKGEINPEMAFESIYKLAYFSSLLPTERITFMNGITFGGGVGMSWSSSIRVSTPNTLWAMPEVTIGFVPDIGASYHLSRINPPELGLYLSLTGERLNGVDCYIFGISEYFIEENIDTVINEMYETGHLKQILEKYHREPDRNKSKILPDLKDLVYCFNTYLGVEYIMYRLRELGTQWSLKTLERLKMICPLSLVIAQEAFRRGRHITYREAFIMEYNLASQLIHHRSENFRNAVKNKLIAKSKHGVGWVPDKITSIGDTTIRPYFINEEGRKLELPKL